MELDLPFTVLGKVDKIKLSAAIDTEIVSLAKMNLCPAFSSSQLVAFDDKQVHNSFFIARISRSLDINIASDIAQPSKSRA